MAAEWYPCEDCMASGGQRNEYGEGNCGTCGGSGRLPGNQAAFDILAQEEERRQDAIYASLERDYDREY